MGASGLFLMASDISELCTDVVLIGGYVGVHVFFFWGGGVAYVFVCVPWCCKCTDMLVGAN